MTDQDCVRFLQWALPRLRMRWPGFRKVRRQVCKHIDRRLKTLGLADVEAYRRHLLAHPEEWSRLDALCRITISRFCRDRGLFQCLERQVLPVLGQNALARGDRRLHAWSAGCAGGEEPYTLAILWRLGLRPRLPDLTLHILATDADDRMLERARRACYQFSSMKELPPAWCRQAFVRSDDEFCLKAAFRSLVSFEQQDIRHQMPQGKFDLILCRNLVFTYFDTALQQQILEKIGRVIRPGGALVLGKHERLPAAAAGWSPWFEHNAIYRHDE
ncbi:MAG TPA: methyltransferase domain-containing protein [Sedimenticola sp.]|nr:methyltransferase domain-containing protein [Sedimenticola sp.]